MHVTRFKAARVHSKAIVAAAFTVSKHSISVDLPVTWKALASELDSK
jgi:hypothetical protein